MGSNDQVALTINTPQRFIHYSDGVDEEMPEEQVEITNCTPNDAECIDPKSLSWVPWVSYYIWKSGTKALNVVDYAGENLAHFFGITTPKYQIEINEYERLQEEKKKIEEETAGWIPKNSGGDIPLVLNEPIRDSNIHEPA
ncbi:protein FAM177A1-like [Leptidea sinapis]|uniref:Protein FAM177A1 n=1 Tax=Leptidea sinapis TaxID=189913 RepID=A0A5E4R3P9_9NEOP|nr:protein FAM177A1-like [Leptidea sinapis]VVD05028.1 unnamed protein product [Leptidea sinapis]